MSATIKLHVSTADVLPVTNSMSSSDQMSTNVSISMNATMPLIDAMTMPPAEIPLVATHVNVTLVSLGMDSNVLISMSAMTTHVMLLQPVPIALVHSAANVNTDGLVMDSLVPITMNAKMVFNGWTKSVLTMHSVPILMVGSHATVTLDTLVTASMSASISMNVRLVKIIAMLMHPAPILTAVSPAPVTMASPVTVLPAMMSMNAKVKMNATPTVHALILMAVMNAPVTKVTMVMDLSAWIMTSVQTLKITAAHLTQLVPILTVHIPAHVMSVTEADPMTVSSVSLTMNMSKIPTTSM